MTISEICTAVLAVASAVVLLSNAAKAIAEAWQAAKAPNEAQNTRLDKLEAWRREVDQRLVNGNTHFDSIDEGNRVTQQALLALLAHGLDGNAVEQMKDAKKALEAHLINR